MLTELDTALFSHFQIILESINPAFTPDRMAFSLVNDQKHHFLLMEEIRSGFVEDGEEDDARVKFPFAILQRDLLQHTEWNNHGSSRNTNQNIIISKDTGAGTARIVQAMPIDISYNLTIYNDNVEVLTDLIEFWLLNAGGNFTKITFTIPEADDEEIDATIALEQPEPVYPALEESRQEGLVFSQSFPIVLRTILIGEVTDAKIILTNIRNIKFI